MDYSLIGALAARDGLISQEKIISPEENKEDKEVTTISRDDYIQLRGHVQEVARQQMQLDEVVRSRDLMIRSRFKSIVLHSMRELNILVDEPEVPNLVQKLFDEILGFGPLEKYFFDPEVTEIKVNGTRIRVEKHGKEIECDQKFESVEHAKQVAERMIAPTGRRLDPASPRVNARLFDGSRLIAQIEPIAVDGILITIRRYRQDINADTLIKKGSMSRDVIEFIRAAVIARTNIVVSGGTSSGKTTVLNVVASFIPEKESIITIEDPAELQLQHPDVRRTEARPPSLENKGEVTMRDLLADALRMAPDRIIVGECRKGEAFDMLQAMNTGHLGSLTTAHSNSARHCVMRMVNMVQQAGIDLPYDAILDQIADAVDIIIHVQQDKTGRRRLDHIIEIAGTKKSAEGRTIDVEFNVLWQYNDRASNWEWVAEKFFRSEKLFREGGWCCPS